MAKVLGMRETELCLGLPGGSGGANNGGGGVVAGAMKSGKRGRFPHSVDLKLKLDSSLKDFFGGVAELDSPTKSPVKPPAKAQVVGWPPVRSYRKNTMATTHKTTSDANNTNTNDKKDNDNVNKGKKSANTTAATTTTVAGGGLLKVSIDGAPYLRKVDLKLYHSYKELLNALGNLFSAFAVPPGNYNEAQGMIDFMNERKLMNLLNSSEFVPTYEDKDGDWMLVGDVPWDMFVDSCKRLRIMKGSDAIGLAPRATEKCKKRS